MKSELILISAIMLCAQIEYQMDSNKILRTNLQTTSQTVNMLSNLYRERQAHTYKYTSPMTMIKLTSPYGYRELNNPFTGGIVSGEHKGLDMVGNWRCEIKPIAMNGEVIDKWYVPGRGSKGHTVFGGYVRIRHQDDWISAYGHLSSIYVKEGDLLIDGLFYRNGQVISSKGVLGRQGNTGISTGEHLHLSIQRPDGKFVDPIGWVEL